MKTRFILLILTLVILQPSCKRGCKESKACNYNKKAIRKGTCAYEPDVVNRVALKYSSFPYYGLNLANGDLVESTAKMNGYLYCDKWNGSEAELNIEGGEGVRDMGPITGLCEIQEKSGPFGKAPVFAAGRGYLVHENTTNKYVRVCVETINTDGITLRWEYDF